MVTSFYTEEELTELGFKKVGKNVLISHKASIYGAGNMTIGNNVRIDDFCILSGHIEIGNYVHIAAGTYLFGGDAGVIMEDYTAISSGSCIYAVSDDYGGDCFTNPTLPVKYRIIKSGQVVLKKHVIIGTKSVIMPNVILGEGCAIGAMSLVLKNTLPWKIYAGTPVKEIKDRSKKLIQLEKEFSNND